MQWRWTIPAFLLAVAALSGGVWRYGYLQALDQLAKRAEADLALASDRLTSQLQVHQELAVLMASHPGLVGLDDPRRQADAQALLLEVADKTGALDVIYADANGTVLAAARGAPGGDLSATRYFQRATHGALGSDHGLVESLGRRAYYFASPTFGDTGEILGILVVIADVEAIERSWLGDTPAVYFTDTGGDVFITSRSELISWDRPPGGVGLVPADGPAPAFSAGWAGPHEIWQLDWGSYLPERALHLARDLPVIGLTGEVLQDVAPARRLAGLQASAVAAICLAFGAVLFLVTERRRALAQVNEELETRVADRTAELTGANTLLRKEVAERQEAEAALKQAQADLVQAGKLSALGQMSAGISHELNQPLMAISSYADNGAEFLKRGRSDVVAENLDRISDMVRRMGRIIKNLRAFARQESEAAGRVDLVAVLDSVIDLTEARLRRDEVALYFERPAHPVWVRGGEVRLGQVFVNLVVNAADAMQDTDRRAIWIAIADGEDLCVTVRDSGPGIDMPDKVFEPFYTTKQVGRSVGMGLGLSISYGIVQSFGGAIRGENAPDGGAVFTVHLERWREEQAA